MEERIMANITAMMEAQQYALLSTLSQTQPPYTRKNNVTANGPSDPPIKWPNNIVMPTD
jgi:hypothetical protein